MNLQLPTGMTAEQAQQILASAAQHMQLKKSQDDERQNILECDGAFNKFCWINAHEGPIVRAFTYDKTERWQEFSSFLMSGDCRRPVVMKGARSSVIARYSLSSPHARNGYCNELFFRVVRKQRASFFTEREVSDYFHSIYIAILHKHGPRQYKQIYCLPNHCLVKGKLVQLSDTQKSYINGLIKIAEKSRKLDRILGAA
jgi:hypothetical protein